MRKGWRSPASRLPLTALLDFSAAEDGTLFEPQVPVALLRAELKLACLQVSSEVDSPLSRRAASAQAVD